MDKSSTLKLISLAIGALLLTFSGLYRSLKADSPLTSTDFFTAYSDIAMVKDASTQGVIDREIARFLFSPANTIDVKAAVINALSWDAEGKENAGLFLDFLSSKYQQDSREELMQKISPDELFCLGYLTALDDYFHPEKALPLLESAKEKQPQSFTVALIFALAKAEQAMEEDWCQVWRLTEAVLNNGRLKRDIRQEAVDIVVNYMIAYKDYCDAGAAPDSALSQADDPCHNPQTQAELNACAEAQYKKADAELNRVYNEVMAKLRPEMQQKLRQAQRAWIAYRDAHCHSQAFDYTGGTIYSLVYFNCLTELTNRRIEEIKSLLRP